ncbi:DNA primase [Bacillaceae bacterium Marseille-Q3522]|nr:DNA primase [Bacillaceae bacterium Marseille-Q3522]
MSERIAEEKINEVRQSADIVDVISDYVQLNKQGRNYVGLCPFHQENTPSFSVSPDKQLYHCFGCGAGGNVFTFLMEIEGLSFQEATLKLAERNNIDVGIPSSDLLEKKKLPGNLQEMFDIHEFLCKFYHHLLINTKEGQHALEYLLKRGFTLPSIEKFQIGYALDSWDFGYKLLTKRKFRPSILEQAGIIIRRKQDESYFDRFRNRIMFPVFDRNGKIVAFSGRSIGDDGPKYLNSPETAIFQKSKILYNLHLARPSIKRNQQAVLFEGFADVISADRAGIENGIATMGTSLTDEHVAILRRNVQGVTICFDGDHAGMEAAFRAATMLSEAGCQIKITMLPEGLDPDEYINKYGNEKFYHEITSASVTFMGFKFAYYRREKNLKNEGERLLYIEQLLEEIAKLDNAVERDHYLRQLAQEFSLTLEALQEQLRQIHFSKKRKRKTGEEHTPKLQSHMIKKSREIHPAYYNAERSLLACMLKSSDLAYKVQEILKGNTFNIDDHQAIFTYMLAFYENGNDANVSAFINFIDDEKLKSLIADIEMIEAEEELSEQALHDYIHHVLKHKKMLKIKHKQSELKEAEQLSDMEKALQLLTEIQQLQKSL